MEPIFLLTGLCCSFPRNCLSNSTPQNSHGIHYSLSQEIWSPYYILKILAMDCVLSCSIRQVCHQFYWFKQLSRMVKRAMPFYSLSLFFLAHSPHQRSPLEWHAHSRCLTRQISLYYLPFCLAQPK